MSKVTITYNGTSPATVTEVTDQTTPIDVTYNGVVITSLGDGDTKTLNCSNKYMSGNVICAGKTLSCADKTMGGAVEVACENSVVITPITLTNPNSALVIYSLAGNLYTDSACTTLATINTKYTQNMFYYKDTKPTGSYMYETVYNNYVSYITFNSSTTPTTNLPTRLSIENMQSNISIVRALFGSSSSCYCWSDYARNASDYDFEEQRFYHYVVTSKLRLSDASYSYVEGSGVFINMPRFSQTRNSSNFACNVASF